MSDQGKGSGEGGHGGRGCLRGLFVFSLVSGVLLFLFIFFGLGTERGRVIVQDWLEKQFSMDLTIGRARIGGGCELVVDDIASRESGEGGEPVFKIKELKAGLRFDGTCRISAYRVMLTLAPGKKGGWTPSVFGNLGSLPQKHMGDLSKMTCSFRRRISLHITDSSVAWVGKDGIPSFAVSGLSFDLKPLSVPDRDIYFYRLEAYNVLGSDNTNIHNVERQWLASDAAEYVAVDKLSPQTIVPAAGFWEIK